MEQRDWYGCPEGEVINYDSRSQLYHVRHPDKTVLTYSRSELMSGVLKRLIWRAQKNIIEKEVTPMKRITRAQQDRAIVLLQVVGMAAIGAIVGCVVSYYLLF
jgi:hypothetical protein|tara:strand:- start:389 stop:697 length:309 start_codon:yes stop_codon:yes gene_type:complete